MALMEVNTTVDPIGSLVNLGAVGAVLAYFLVRTDPRLERLESSVDRLARAQMLTLIALPSIEPSLKQAAQQIINELDEAKAKRS